MPVEKSCASDGLLKSHFQMTRPMSQEEIGRDYFSAVERMLRGAEIEMDRAPCGRERIVCHPDSLNAIIELLPRLEAGDGDGTNDFRRYAAAIDFVPDPMVPKHPTRWEFPADPFIEYEKRDERWCRYFGIGAEIEDRTKLAFYRVAVGGR